MSHYIKAIGTVLLIFCYTCIYGQGSGKSLSFEFYGSTFNLRFDNSIIVDVPQVLTGRAIKDFYKEMAAGQYQPTIDSLTGYKERHQLNDWLYYQLIRKTAGEVSPKADNYSRYTLYKWFLMVKSGYDARLALSGDKIIFYILNNEDVSDIPFFMIDDKKYMTLNYHDYVKLDLQKDKPLPVKIEVPGADKAFSYKVTKMPDFKPDSYISKLLNFSYHNREYYFDVKLNTDVGRIFANYPIVDFESYFNIPLSKETYNSLIPLLKQNVKGMNQKKGIDYLMRFTRNAFLYEDDEQNFGKEKRMSPEETLFSKYSDCDDRAALFFCLVKEIYNMPMIVLLYPTHINIAVQFNKPVGTPIVYNGKVYSECEPTPQLEDLRVGQISAKLKNVPYKVVYQYEPVSK